MKPVDADRARTSHGAISIWYSNNPQEVQWGKQVVKAWNAAHPGEKVSGQEIPIAEVGWSPQAARTWDTFRVRLAAQAPRWTALGLNFYRAPEVPWPR